MSARLTTGLLLISGLPVLAADINVYSVAKDSDSCERREFFEDWGITGAAAIVNHHDRAETQAGKRVDEFHQHRSGPIGGNQNGCGAPCGIRRHRPLL